MATDVNYIGQDSRQQLGILRTLPFGVKYLLITMISQGRLSWSSFELDCVQHLRALSNSAVMHKISQSPLTELLPCAGAFLTPALLNSFEELDAEEQLLETGATNLYVEQTGWFGGKVSLSGTVSLGADGQVRIHLRAPCVRTSSRFTRRFGSRRFLRLKLSKMSYKEEERKALDDYFRKPVCLLDCAYRLFCVKESTLFLFELGADIPSIWDLYNWHGPWEDNLDAKMLKYLQRIPLGLSTSIPGPLISCDRALVWKDIVSPSAMLMTDGAAPISRQVMIGIAKLLELQSVPTAVQARYDGAKGVWYVASASEEASEAKDSTWIAVRESQRKLKRCKVSEPSHQILDVLRYSRVTTPSCLSRQILMVLCDSGVPHDALLEMQEEQLRRVVGRFVGQDGKLSGRGLLAKALDELGGVYVGRLRRTLSHTASAIGLLSRSAEDMASKAQEEGEEGETGETTVTTYQTIFEKAYDMLQAGFEAEESKTLSNHIVQATKIVLDRVAEKFQISVERSAEVLVIPDPVGVLEEGEIQLRFGLDCPVDPSTLERIASLSGNVLVTRHPCLAPTDIRKVVATMYSELAAYTDVVVFSTKGNTPLAHYLSGGDHDGDTIRVFWEPSLVEPFRNADPAASEPSISISDAFHQDSTTVADFYRAYAGVHREEQLSTMLRASLRGSDGKGMYGNLHLAAAYMLGTHSQEAIDMAFMFNNSMDGIKTGLRVKEDLLRADKYRFDRLLPDWDEGRKKSLEYRNEPRSAQRLRQLGPSVLDVLWRQAQSLVDQLKSDLEEQQKKRFGRFEPDEDLAHRWNDATAKGCITPLQREAMMEHCRSVLKLHQMARLDYRREREVGSQSPQKWVRLQESTSSPRSIARLSSIPGYFEGWTRDRDVAFEIAGRDLPADHRVSLADCLDEGELERLHRLLASCLYIQACKARREDVAFDLAASDLLHLKAERVGKRQASCRARSEYSVVAMPRRVAHGLRLGRLPAASAG